MYRARNLATTWHRACFLQPVRTYASRKGGGSESKFRRKVQRTEEEVRHLERKFDSSTKSKQHKHSSPLPPTSIASIYASISDIQTPSPAPRSKINPLFLENLKLKFLDTRGADAGEDIGALTEITADQLRIAKVGRWTLGEPEFNQLLYANALAKRPAEAEAVLELMKEYNITPTLRSYNHLLDAYANAGDSHGAIATFKRIRAEAFTPDVYTFSTLIKAFVSHSRLDDAFIVFDRMREGGVVPSQPVFATLISGCLRAGELNRAWDTFDDMRLKYHCPDEVTYTLMIGACAKNGEVERALNLFTELSTTPTLYPTDVTFNTVISACARRSDYFNEAFSLLAQMRDVHGFRPDRITYNTLLKACARRGDLKRARLIFAEMMKAQRDGEDDVAPNAVTYTNLLWCYASYRAPTPPGARAGVKKTEINAVDQTIAVPHESATLIQHVTTDLAILPPTHPLFPTPPTTRAEILREADSIIMYLCVPPSDGPAPPPLATAHLNAYLATHATHERPQRALEVYDMYAQHGLEPDGHTFNRALEACYRVKDIQFAWKVWEDAERWWEDVEGSRKEEPMGRREQEGLKKNEGKEGLDGISEGEVERRKAGKSEVDSEIGFTEERRYERYKLMVNTLARANDLPSALRLLSTLPPTTRAAHPPRLSDFQTVYIKCIQLEDPVARRDLIAVCPIETGPSAESRIALARKWGTRGGKGWKWEVGMEKRREVGEAIDHARSVPVMKRPLDAK